MISAICSTITLIFIIISIINIRKTNKTLKKLNGQLEVKRRSKYDNINL